MGTRTTATTTTTTKRTTKTALKTTTKTTTTRCPSWRCPHDDVGHTDSVGLYIVMILKTLTEMKSCRGLLCLRFYLFVRCSDTSVAAPIKLLRRPWSSVCNDSGNHGCG